MEFSIRKGFHIKTNAQVVGEYCYQLEQAKGGKLTPKELVEAARDIDSPLHNEFEWDDSIAAEKYREQQAMYIIRSIEVKLISVPAEVTEVNLQITEKNNGVRFYHALDMDGSGYENLYSISEDELKRKKLLQNCLKDIQNFKEKYEVLRNELPALFEAIDNELDKRAS